MNHRDDVPARYALCDRLLPLARRCALRVGLTPDSAEDCALSFVGRVLLDESEAALRPPEMRDRAGELHAPWAARAALNHALDFRRRWERVALRELSWPERAEEARGLTLDGADRAVLRGAVAEALGDGLLGLDPVPRALVVGHHVQGLGVADLAAATGGSAHAAEQRLLRARRRLRSWLERRGWTAGDMLAYASVPGAE